MAVNYWANFFSLATVCYPMVRMQDRLCQAVLHSIVKRLSVESQANHCTNFQLIV